MGGEVDRGLRTGSLLPSPQDGENASPVPRTTRLGHPCQSPLMVGIVLISRVILGGSFLVSHHGRPL